MSQAVRETLTKKVTFMSPEDEGDLLDPLKTHTYLIAMLMELVQASQHPILLTSVYSSHTVDGGLASHGHHPELGPGFSADLWIGDWKNVGDDRILDIIKLLPYNQYCWTVGLGGQAQEYGDKVTWPQDNKFILFTDNNTDHLHLQAGNVNGAGWRS